MEKGIEIISEFDRDGKIRSIRFRVREEDELIVVNVDKLLAVSNIKEKGERYDSKTVYKCRCKYRDMVRDFDLTFHTNTYMWYCKY